MCRPSLTPAREYARQPVPDALQLATSDRRGTRSRARAEVRVIPRDTLTDRIWMGTTDQHH